MEPLSRASSTEEVVAWLKEMASEENRAGMARFGIETSTALGIGSAELRRIARSLKRDHARALDLWNSGIREARLLAAFTEEPDKVDIDRCRRWAGDFASWDIVDGVSDLFAETPFWLQLIDEFAADDREFVRRAAFAMLAWAAVHRRKGAGRHLRRTPAADRGPGARSAQFRQEGRQLGPAADRQAIDRLACACPGPFAKARRFGRQDRALDRPGCFARAHQLQDDGAADRQGGAALTRASR